MKTPLQTKAQPAKGLAASRFANGENGEEADDDKSTNPKTVEGENDGSESNNAVPDNNATTLALVRAPLCLKQFNSFPATPLHHH